MDWLIGIDHQVFHWINSTLTNGVFNVFFPLITDLHKTLAFRIIVPLTFFFLLWKGYKKKAFVFFLGALCCVASTDFAGGQWLKKSFERPRPFNTPGVVAHQRSPASGFSFPSNHAMNTFGIAAYISFFLPGTAPVLYSIAALVAFSRVYNGVHFPSDVLAGALFGFMIAKLLAILFWWPFKPKGETP